MSDFLNKYPYTDFHELNLDWVIARVKKLTEDWLATQEAWNNTQEQWQQLYDYVHDYFANLDVQNEINNKINQMILDGTFMTIVTPTINQTVVDATTAWLADHITQPTTPAIDTSLSIAGAAADSKTVGDKLNLTLITRSVTGLTDLDNATNMGVYTLTYGDSYLNDPIGTNTRRRLITICTPSNVPTCQIIINTDNGDIYSRAYSSGWRSWVKTGPVVDNTLSNAGAAADSKTVGDKLNLALIVRSVTGLTDLNNATDMGVYTLTFENSYLNDPIGANTRRRLITICNPSNVPTCQILINTDTAEMYSRGYSAGWLSWNNNVMTLSTKDVDPLIDDIDNFTVMGLYNLPTGTPYTNSPLSTSDRRLLIVITNRSNVVTNQIMINRDTGQTFTRSYASGTFSAWSDFYSDAVETLADLSLHTLAVDGSLTDLDDFKTMGVYNLGYASEYANDPIGKNTRRKLFVLNNPSVKPTGQIIVNTDNGDIYVRSYASNVWLDWHSALEKIEYTPTTLDTHTHTIAHRGVPNLAPEETAPSFILAKKMGLLIAEGDVRFTSDDVAVLAHNATYTVNGVTHTIASETYAQFMTWNQGKAFDADYPDTYGLTLAEFLDLCNALQLHPTIEFKVGTTQQISDSLDIIDAKRAKIFNYKASVANLKTIIDHDNYASVRLGADDYSAGLLAELNDIINYGNKLHTTHCIFAYGYGTWTAAQIATCRAAGAIMGVSSINNNTQLTGMTEDVDIIFTEEGFNATKQITINAIG